MKYDKLLENGMVTISFYNSKGGVGKSLMSLNTAYTYANDTECPLRVLVIDADPQSSSSQLLRINKVLKDDPLLLRGIMDKEIKKYRELEVEKKPYVLDDLFRLTGLSVSLEEKRSQKHGLYDLMSKVFEKGQNSLTDEDVKNAIVPATYDKLTVTKEKKRVIEKCSYNFDIIPSSFEMIEGEMDWLIRKDGKCNTGNMLYYIVNKIKEMNLYDMVIIDCPPALGLCSLNSLNACINGGVCIVAMSDEQSLLSITRVKKTLRENRSLMVAGKGIGIIGVVMNAISQTTLNPVIKYKIKDTLNLYCFNRYIPRSVNAQKANSAGEILCHYDSRFTRYFEQFCEELTERIICLRLRNEYISQYIENEGTNLVSKENQETYIKKLIEKGRSEKEAYSLLNGQIGDKLREDIDNNPNWKDWMNTDYMEEIYEWV